MKDNNFPSQNLKGQHQLPHFEYQMKIFAIEFQHDLFYQNYPE